MDTLVELFRTTGGELGGWIRADRWLTGEPCVDAWHGITCCPADYPYFKGGRCAKHEARRQLGHTPPVDTSTWECASGFVTGTVADAARCVVVKIDLSRNNLTGTLNSSIFRLPYLKELVLRGNSIRGLLQPLVADRSADLEGPSLLEHIDLSLNEFKYPQPTALFDAVLGRCRRGIDCIGLPPQSCLAFGAEYSVRTDLPERCVECVDRTMALFALLGLVAAFLFLAAIYVFMMLRHPKGLRKWVSSGSILISHLQTVAIVGSLRLAWPKSAKVSPAAHQHR